MMIVLNAAAIAAFPIPIPARRVYDMMFARRPAISIGAIADSPIARNAPKTRRRDASGVWRPAHPPAAQTPPEDHRAAQRNRQRNPHRLSQHEEDEEHLPHATRPNDKEETTHHGARYQSHRFQDAESHEHRLIPDIAAHEAE